jgi:hypothetical protein
VLVPLRQGAKRTHADLGRSCAGVQNRRVGRLTETVVGVVLLVAMAAGVALLRSSDVHVAGPPATTAPTAATMRSTTSTTAATTTSLVAARSCQISDLRVTLQGWQGAGGTTYTSIAFTNQSDSICGLNGHPEVAFLDSAGRVLTRAIPLSSDSPAVALATGELAGSTIGVVSGCLDAPAVSPASVRVVLPAGGSTSVKTNGLWICSGQEPTIGPFRKA